MAKYLYNGVELPALPNGLNAFNYIAKLDEFYFLASAITEEKTINAYGSIRVSSSEGILYNVSGDEWVESGNDNVIGTVVWCDTDIYNTDGTLYLAASDPIPVGTAPALDPLSLFLGWKAGNWVARQRWKKKTPVAYLYNGVRLPDINAVWTDKETYPYASIIRVDAGLEQPGFDGEFYYTLDFADAAPIWDGSKTVWNGPAKLHTFLLTNSDKIATAVGMPIGQWFGGEKNNVGVNGNIAYLLPVTWASVDILNADGTVYLATSDPVPVYE